VPKENMGHQWEETALSALILDIKQRLTLEKHQTDQPPKNDTATPHYLIQTAIMTTEDERYRTSTQYRLWSYTSASLLALRTTTNRLAADRVREAVRRVREARAVSSTDTSDAERGRSVSVAAEGEVDCLTVEEELKLVAFYCRQTSQLGDHLRFPSEVKVQTPSSIYTALRISSWKSSF
jgi:hypothetical protein